MQKVAHKQSTALIKRPVTFADWVADTAEDKFYGRGLSARGFAIGLLIIIVMAATTYASLAFFWGKFSRAEVFFAECAREMLATGNFITPLYHNQPFFDKPIFVYWLIIGMFKTLGVNHFVARVPSLIASLITICSTGLAASYLFGRRAGLAAAAILASAFMYLSFSYLCMSDMFLVMFDTLSLIFIYAGIKFANKRNGYWQIAAISMGFAFLTKGPVGVVLPAVSTLIYMGLTKQLHFVKTRHIIWGIISLAVIASPWFYAAYLANGTSALIHFFIQENLQRFAGSTYDVHKPFWYTIISFLLGFAPWSILLPPAFVWFCRNINESNTEIVSPVRVSDDLHYENTETEHSPRLSWKSFSLLSFELSAELFLWVWLFVTVGFFCFSRGKCDYYTLPAYPAAAILLASYINTCLPKYQRVVQGTALAISVTTIIFACFVLPQLAKLVPVSKYAAIIKQVSDHELDNTEKMSLRIGAENSLFSWLDEILFQSGKDPVCLSDAQQLNKFVDKSGPFLLFVPEDKYNSFPLKQRKGWRILACDKVTTHSLTPGYFISHAGNITDPIPLIVATNVQANK